MKKIIIATTNMGKLNEIQSFLRPFNLTAESMASYTANLTIEEPFLTYQENARHKATIVGTLLQMPVLADDSGLEIHGLNHFPGIHSARYEPTLSYAEKGGKILQKMAKITDRSAAFITAMALFIPQIPTILVQSSTPGTIALSQRGSHGFGYDALFVPYGSHLTYAEMTLEEKNRFSHRVGALRLLEPFFQLLGAQT